MPNKRLIALLIGILVAIGLTTWLIVKSAKFRTLTELGSSIWNGPQKGTLDAKLNKDKLEDAPLVCAQCAGGNFLLQRYLMQSFELRQAMKWKQDEWEQTDCVNGLVRFRPCQTTCVTIKIQEKDKLDSILMECADNLIHRSAGIPVEPVKFNHAPLVFEETIGYEASRQGWIIRYIFNETSSMGADWIANDLFGKVGFRRSKDDMSDLNKALLILLFMATFSAILAVLGWYLTTVFMKLSAHLARKRRHQQRRSTYKKMGCFGNVDSRMYKDKDMDGSEELKVVYTVKKEKVTVKKYSERNLITMEYANLGNPEEIIGDIPNNAEQKLEYEWRRLQEKTVKETQEKTRKTCEVEVVKVDEGMDEQWTDMDQDVFGFPTQKKNFMRTMSNSPFGTLERKEKQQSVVSFGSIEGTSDGTKIEAMESQIGDLPYAERPISLHPIIEHVDYNEWDDEPEDADNQEHFDQKKTQKTQKTEVKKVYEEMEWTNRDQDVFGFPTQKKNFMRSISCSPFETLERKEKQQSVVSFGSIEGTSDGTKIEATESQIGDLPYAERPISLNPIAEHVDFDEWDDESEEADNQEHFVQRILDETEELAETSGGHV
ncbi:unnamed protein product [Caenorhabditis nigoni]|uniref:Uncharacterized protein n=1 Tax=Caenorhabditis nigoni TaxID=1611254 RepID=A0A2G5S9F8_9PELO|nr:hypothetical protein B9Z55_028916 [Caenorhabditis nigoni]